MWKVYLCALVAIASLSACRKKPDPVIVDPASTKGDLRVTFQNVAGTQPLVLNTGWYQNANGDSFQVFIYKYYISNIVLVREDGSTFAEQESYHLIDEAINDSKSFTLKDVPAGTYKKISFLIGVDEARNTSGAQTGALDPIHGMFWDWNSGYIMAKLEGTSPQSLVAEKKITYHTGGFEGDQSVLRTVTLDFPQDLVIKSGTLPNAHIKSDVLEWFQTPSAIKIAEHPVIMLGSMLTAIANNYSDMFTVDHID